MQDCQIIIKEHTNKVDITIGSIHSFMREDLGFRRILVKFVPNLLVIEQKQIHLEITETNWGQVVSDNFHARVTNLNTHNLMQ